MRDTKRLPVVYPWRAARAYGALLAAGTALLDNGGSDAFLDGYIAQRRAEGSDPLRFAGELRQMEAMRVSYRNPLYRIPLTFTELAPVGVLVSLVAAGLLRNPRVLPAR